jgi:hypothetical protein
MRDRPHQERKDFAAACAFVVVVILFFGWIVLFARNIESTVSAQNTQPIVTRPKVELITEQPATNPRIINVDSQ